MKRYLLFAYESYEAFGGVNDLIGDFDNLDIAKQNIPKYICHCQILDTYTKKLIEINTETSEEKISTLHFKIM